jgi:hypothetical protein
MLSESFTSSKVTCIYAIIFFGSGDSITIFFVNEVFVENVTKPFLGALYHVSQSFTIFKSYTSSQ